MELCRYILFSIHPLIETVNSCLCLLHLHFGNHIVCTLSARVRQMGEKKSSALVIISKKSFLFFPFDKKVTFSEKLIIREVCSRILRKHLIFSKLSWFLVQKIMKEGYITSSFGLYSCCSTVVISKMYKAFRFKKWSFPPKMLPISMS